MKQKFFALAAVVALAFAVVRIVSYFIHRNAPPEVSMNRYAAMGLGMAEETANRLNNQGNVLVIDAPDRPAGNQLDRERLEQFRETAENRGMKIVAVEKLPLEMFEDAGIPSAYFSELLARHDGVDGVVSFGGAPNFEGSDLKTAGKMPPVFLGDGGSSDLKQLLQQGIVGFTIEPVYGTELADVPPQTLREWFDTYFRVVTAESILEDEPAVKGGGTDSVEIP